MDTQNLKKLFEQASTEIPKDVLASISGKESLGVWRQGDVKGELVFCVNDIFYKAKTPSLDWDIFDYSIVLFKKLGVSNKPPSYRVLGAGKKNTDAFLQILKWTDFNEYPFPLRSFILSGKKQVTLKVPNLRVHSNTKTDVLIFDETEGVMAKGFSYRDFDAGGIVRLDRSEIDFVSREDWEEFDKFLTSTSATDEIGTPFSEMRFNGVSYRILHDHDDSKAKLLGRIPFEIADIKKTSPQLSNIAPAAFILAKTIFQKLRNQKNGSMIMFDEIVRDYHDVKLVQDLLNEKKGIFTKQYDCYGLTKAVFDYAESHGWGTSPEAQYPLGGVGDARSEGVGRQIASSTQLSYKAPKGKTTEVEAAGVANAIDSSVIESPKQQGTLEMPSGREKDQPRWENLPEDPESEKKSIIDFYEALGKAGWQFSLRDIVRFHTSVRCEPLTILGGAPGSGKSSLARMYARYFGLGEDKSFLSIDVQPSWHDRMDFLGFVKTHESTHEFVPSETGVAKFLKDAETDNGKSGIWLACLEEINLARPEHYFADFLQRISLDDFTRAKTPIEFNGLLGKEADKGRFTLVPSVRFIGTCNFDETTQNFSARFLDRCNYIEFQPMRIIDSFFPAAGKHPELLEFDSDKKSKWTWHPQETFSRKRMDTEKNKKDVTTLITNCEESLKTLGVLPSPRVVSSMIRYIETRIDSVDDELADEHDRANTEQDSNAKNAQTGDDNKGTSTEPTTVFQRAFDEAFAQRILSKLSTSRGCYPGTGTKTTLEDLKGKLILNNVPLSLCSKMIEQYIRQFNTMMNV